MLVLKRSTVKGIFPRPFLFPPWKYTLPSKYIHIDKCCNTSNEEHKF